MKEYRSLPTKESDAFSAFLFNIPSFDQASSSPEAILNSVDSSPIVQYSIYSCANIEHSAIYFAILSLDNIEVKNVAISSMNLIMENGENYAWREE